MAYHDLPYPLYHVNDERVGAQLTFEDFISPRQIDFAERYIHTLDEQQSAWEAGYRFTDYKKGCLDLLNKATVRRYVLAGLQERPDAHRGKTASIIARMLSLDIMNADASRSYHEGRQARAIRGGSGFVYFIHSETGLTKIGRSINPVSRLASLQVGLPYRLKMLFAIKSEGMAALEGEMFARFGKHRAAGEWFALTEEHLQALRLDLLKSGAEVVVPLDALDRWNEGDPILPPEK